MTNCLQVIGETGNGKILLATQQVLAVVCGIPVTLVSPTSIDPLAPQKPDRV